MMVLQWTAGAWKWVTQCGLVGDECGVRGPGRVFECQEGRGRKAILVQSEWSLRFSKERFRRLTVHEDFPMNFKQMWTFDNTKRTTIAISWLFLMAWIVFSEKIHWSPNAWYFQNNVPLDGKRVVVGVISQIKMSLFHGNLVSYISLPTEDTWTQRHCGEMATWKQKDSQRESLVMREAGLA